MREVIDSGAQVRRERGMVGKIGDGEALFLDIPEFIGDEDIAVGV